MIGFIFDYWICSFVSFLVASLHAQYFEPEESTDDEGQSLTPAPPDEWRKVLINAHFLIVHHHTVSH